MLFQGNTTVAAFILVYALPSRLARRESHCRVPVCLLRFAVVPPFRIVELPTFERTLTGSACYLKPTLSAVVCCDNVLLALSFGGYPLTELYFLSESKKGFGGNPTSSNCGRVTGVRNCRSHAVVPPASALLELDIEESDFEGVAEDMGALGPGHLHR